MTPQPFVSIVIPHYQTPELVKLCLRSVRRYTQDVPYEVIVVDNGSKDAASLNYLRSVQWIRLIERGEQAGTGAQAHKEAVDIGFQEARGELLLTIHTDTIPIRSDWLKWLVEQLLADQRIAAVGSYKLELPRPWTQALKQIEKTFGKLLKKKTSNSGSDNDRPYIRSHCALYRKDVLQRLGLSYNDRTDETAGRLIHLQLEQHGYIAKLLPVEEMLQRLVHLNHATMVLRPELGAAPRTIIRGRRRIKRFLSRPEIIQLLNDNSLDSA